MLTDWDISPDGRHLLTSCWSSDCPDDPPDQAVDVWDLAKGGVVRVLDARDTDVRVDWPSKDILIAHSRKGTGVKEITVWDARSFEVLHAESHYCAYARVDPGGTRVLFTGCDGNMQIFDSGTRKLVERPVAEAHLGGDYSVAGWFSNDGKHVYVDDERAGLQLLDARTLRRRTVLRASIQGVGPDGAPVQPKTAQSPSGERFALLDGSGGLKLLDHMLSTKKVVAPAGSFDHIQWMGFLDERRIQLKAEDGTVKVVDVATGKVDHTFSPAATGSPATTSEPPCQLWLGGSRSSAKATLTRSDCTVSVLDGATLSPKWVLPAVPASPSGQPSAPDLRFSPDERHLAAVHDERLLVVYDAETGREETRLQLPAGMSQLAKSGSSYRPLALDWSADSRFVVIAQGEVFLVRPGDGAFVVLGMFAMDGRRVPTVTSETEVEAPKELEACTFRKPAVPGSPPLSRRATSGVLARFMAAP